MAIFCFAAGLMTGSVFGFLTAAVLAAGRTDDDEDEE